MREDFEREISYLKRELKQAQSRINAQDELEREREALRTKAAEADRAELVTLRRELGLLREELATERGLRTLQGEVEAARAEIPKVPAIITQLQTETQTAQTDANRKIVALDRELRSAKEKISKLRVQNSQIEHSLKQLERGQPEPGIELKFETQQSSFSLRDMHPDAAAAWKRFVAGVLESPQDETATMLLTDLAAGTA